jgi:hypothetical protein
MQKLTNFLSKSNIKPEISMVYVHEIDGLKYAVATDSFRLIQERLPDILQDIVSYGYYQPKAWTEIVKATNKKIPDIGTILDTVAGQEALQMRYSGYNYPNYQAIIPKEEALLPFDPAHTYNMDYLKDFLDIITLDKYNSFSFSYLKMGTNKGMLYYKTDTTLVLLMAINK